MVFAVKQNWHLALQMRADSAERRLGVITQAVNSRQTDALALTTTRALPLEIEDIFGAAQLLHQRDFGTNATKFHNELQYYAKALGFATSLMIGVSPEITQELYACNLLVGDPNSFVPLQVSLNSNFPFGKPVEVEKGVFGSDYEDLRGRSIIVSLSLQKHGLGLLSFSVFIAHELACIKLAEKMAKSGLKEGDISKEAEKFFCYAYQYTFTYYLLRTLLNKSVAVDRSSNNDLVSVAQNFGQTYAIAMQNFEKMASKEKRRFIIVQDRHAGMGFNCPFSADLITGPVKIKT